MKFNVKCVCVCVVHIFILSVLENIAQKLPVMFLDALQYDYPKRSQDSS